MPTPTFMRLIRSYSIVALASIASMSILSHAAFAQTPAYSVYGSQSGDAATVIHQYDFTAANSYIGNSVAINTGVNYVNGLAFSNTDNRMFYRSGFGAATGESGAGTFYTWNRNTRQQTAIAWSGSGVNVNPIGGNGNTSSIAFASGAWYNGAYYSVAAATNDLYKVTFNTDFTTYTAQLWVSNANNGGVDDSFSFGDIAIVQSGANAGLLYGFGTANGNTPQFFRGGIPNAPATTLVNPSRNLFNAATGANTAALNPNVQLSLAPDQTRLYGVTLAGDWVNMNPSDGTRTDNTNIPTITGRGFTDLTGGVTYQPVPAPPAAISLGIGGLVSMIGTGVSRMRRRNKSKKA